MASVEKVDRITFGTFEVDLQAGELWKAGFRIRLQGQPFKVLTVLLSKPGEVVTREELQLQVWGSNTTVDFERALAGAVNKVREALGDSADNPRFVETLTRRGYRFIAPVTSMSVASARPASHHAGPQETTQIEAGEESLPVLEPLFVPDHRSQPQISPILSARASEVAVELGRSSQPRRTRNAWAITLGALAVVLLLGFVLALPQWRRQPDLAPLRIAQLTHDSPISAGPPGMENLLTLVTDGDRILTSVMEDGKPQLSAIYMDTAEVQRLTLPRDLESVSLTDISKDGSKLLLRSHLSSESEQPLWVAPSAGGSAFRVGNVLAHDASWMPDGTGILYATGNDLSVIRLDDGTSVRYATLPGRAFWLRWSPNGRLLRFTLMDPLNHTSSLWEMEVGNRIPRPLKISQIDHLAVCCGNWTADGSAYVFQASDSGTSDIWKLGGSSARPTLTQLTNGPLRYMSPVAARSGSRIFFLGLDQPSGLQQFVEGRHEFQPIHSVFSEATRIDYTRDGHWVAWTDPDGRLWRAHAADGSDKIQLTPGYLEVFLAHWSPDGKRLAVMAREPGKAWQIYLINASGGRPEALLKETRNAADPGWSPDGRSLVFGREPDLMGKDTGSHAIEILDLESQKTTALPDSEGLFSPRWSPDGKWIVALSLDQEKVMLFDMVKHQWKQLASTSAADPVWSNDSKAVYVHAFMAEKEPLLRVSIPDGAIKTVADLSSFRSGDTANYFFGGLTPQNLPLVQPRIGTGNLYTLDLDRR